MGIFRNKDKVSVVATKDTVFSLRVKSESDRIKVQGRITLGKTPDDTIWKLDEEKQLLTMKLTNARVISVNLVDTMFKKMLK